MSKRKTPQHTIGLSEQQMSDAKRHGKRKTGKDSLVAFVQWSIADQNEQEQGLFERLGNALSPLPEKEMEILNKTYKRLMSKKPTKL